MELKSAHQKLLHALPGTSDFPVTNVFSVSLAITTELYKNGNIFNCI